MLWILIGIASTSRCNSNDYPQHMPFKEVDKKYTGFNLKVTELLDCGLIGICAVIRSNTVFVIISFIWCTGTAVFRDCGIACVSSLTVL